MRGATLTELMDRLLDQDETIKTLRRTVRRQDASLGQIRAIALEGQGIEKNRSLASQQDASLGSPAVRVHSEGYLRP